MNGDADNGTQEEEAEARNLLALLEGRWDTVALPTGLASDGIDFPLPGGAYTKIGCVSFSLTTSGTAGNRQVVVSLVDGSDVPVFQIAAVAVQAATQVVRYSFAENVPEFGSGALGAIGGPFVSAGSEADNLRLVVAVTGNKPTDALSDGRLLAKQRVRPGVVGL